MLTLFSLTNASQAAQYYEEDNYYHRGSIESIASTHWWGKGAEKLGLSDYVDLEKFVELLEGKIDRSTKLSRVRHDDGVAHKPGYDLTFSAPKSVSILAEIGRDYRIHEAHNRAINEALEYLQSRSVRYRQTINSLTQTYQSQNLIVAKFRHDTSRSVNGEVDCQLHTHCVVLNATVCEDGRWRSLSENPLFDFKMTGGMIYRSALARELKGLGYEIEKTREDGLFEISGFSRDQIEAFSTRRVKIIEVMEKLGISGAEAAQSVTLSLREGKQAIDRDKLQEGWQERAIESGIDGESLMNLSFKRQKALKKEKVSPPTPTIQADQALSYAILHLSERESVFQEKEIIRVSLQYALGEIGVVDVEQAMERSKSTGDLVFLKSHQHLDFYTSVHVLTQEKQIIEIMKNGLNSQDPLASQEAVKNYIDQIIQRSPEGKKPTPCQLKAIQFLATSPHQITGIQGYAGTGKTTLLNAICRLAESAGYELRGAAPSASASDVLRSESGITTETLSSLLIELQKEKSRVGLHWSVGLLGAENHSPKPEIILLDEASMVSTKQMRELLTLAHSLKKRVFLIGDRQQLPAVEAGSPFGLLQDSGMPFETLTQVVRQEAQDLQMAVKKTIEGAVEQAFSAIGNQPYIQKNSDGEALWNKESRIHVLPHKAQRLQAISSAYLNLDSDTRDQTIVLLGSNEDRQRVNASIREGLKTQGMIAGPEAECAIFQARDMTVMERSHHLNYEVGDILRFNKAYRSLGIQRYDYLTVRGIDREKQELILQYKNHSSEIRWKPEGSSRSKGSAVEVLRQEKRTLAAGDFIRWTQNRKDQRIFNTETAQVIAISEKNKGKKVATVKLKRGDLIELDLTNPVHLHWDYAWSSTIYAAQGKKARHVIAQLEGSNPNLTNYRSFYVTLSRAVNTVQLYVDDREKAMKTIVKHTGDKSNATEFLRSGKVGLEEKIHSNGFEKTQRILG